LQCLKIILCTISKIVKEENVKYTIKITILYFISELCKKFFHFPELLNFMTQEIADKQEEEIIIFSTILNIFKTDQLILEYENKKLVRI
jgi:hypothetical protein